MLEQAVKYEIITCYQCQGWVRLQPSPIVIFGMCNDSQSDHNCHIITGSHKICGRFKQKEEQ